MDDLEIEIDDNLKGTRFPWCEEYFESFIKPSLDQDSGSGLARLAKAVLAQAVRDAYIPDYKIYKNGKKVFSADKANLKNFVKNSGDTNIPGTLAWWVMVSEMNGSVIIPGLKVHIKKHTTG